MKTILLVGDDKKIQNQIKKALKGLNVSLSIAASVTTLKNELKSDDPILVLFDSAIKNNKRFITFFSTNELKIPIIVLTPIGGESPALDGIVSIHWTIHKPIVPSEVARIAKNALNIARLKGEKEKQIRDLQEFKNKMECSVQEKNESLDESLLNYYTVVEQTHEGIVIVQKGKIVFTNSRFAKIIHFNSEEVLGKDLSIFFPPEIEEKLRKIELDGMAKLDGEYLESNILTKEGKIIPIDVNIQETTFNKSPSAIVFLEDITERKKLQTQLIHTSNLAAIGQIAIGLAHDINTPLANISLLSENISGHADDEFIQRKLDTLDKQVDVITNIIKNLLSVYRRSREMYSDLNINEAILDTLNISKDLILHNLEMELHFDDDLPFIMGNPEQLGQVFLNLILNSDDSLPESGMLTIKTYFDDKFVYVDFADNGCGIPEDKIYSIFDPFYTTKKPNKGVGLGLSICQGIILSHNGKIEVKSVVDEGTTFTVMLRR